MWKKLVNVHFGKQETVDEKRLHLEAISGRDAARKYTYGWFRSLPHQLVVNIFQPSALLFLNLVKEKMRKCEPKQNQILFFEHSKSSLKVETADSFFFSKEPA